MVASSSTVERRMVSPSSLPSSCTLRTVSGGSRDDGTVLVVRLPPELWLFVPAPQRQESVEVAYDGTSSLGHVVTSLGIPLTEVGELRVGARTVGPSYRPADGDVVTVFPVRLPQHAPTSPPRFLLDVHLGALARRMRVLGLDTAYGNDASDDVLVEQALREQRVLLSKDRGLLRRRAVVHGGYVRGDDPDGQLADVVARFAPLLAPWTRCTACNGVLHSVAKADVEPSLAPWTRRTYDRFARCPDCGRIYWRGAHYARLSALVERFTRAEGPPANGHDGG
jgi:uncharacterized protein with PIN domain